MELLNITNDISSEIFIIYAVIAFIIGLIIFTIILDKKEKKMRELTRTKELQLMDVRKADENYIERYKKQPFANEIELLDVNEEDTDDLVNENELKIDKDQYIEDDLEKTSAQLQLEMLAQELEKAPVLQRGK